jgi:RNA polymerase sigma factor (sigma-70 family)
MEDLLPEKGSADRTRVSAVQGQGNVTPILDRISRDKQVEVLKKYQPLIKSIARTFLYSGLPLAELRCVGLEGAWKGICKSHGVPSAAYLRDWIDGEIRRYCRKDNWIVPGTRTEKSKRLGAEARESIEYFGNVAIGDGSFQPDVSRNAEISADGEHGDDEAGGGTYGDKDVDRGLERCTGDLLHRVTRGLSKRDRALVICAIAGESRKELAARFGITPERVRQILTGVAATRFERTRLAVPGLPEGSWALMRLQLERTGGKPDHETGPFLWDYGQYQLRGIGYLYRPQQLADKMPRGLLPHNRLYQEPDWAKKKQPAMLVPTHGKAREEFLKRVCAWNRRHEEKCTSWARVCDGWAPKRKNDKEAPTDAAQVYGYADRDPAKAKREAKRKAAFGLVLPRDAGPPKDEGFRLLGTSRGNRTYVLGLRHVDYKGRPLEQPYRPTPFVADPPKKAPALPPELTFLSRSGVKAWKKAAKKSYLKREGWHWSPQHVVGHTLFLEVPDSDAAARPWNKHHAGISSGCIKAAVDALTPTPRVRVLTSADKPLPAKSPEEWRDNVWPTIWTLEEFMRLTPDAIPTRPNFDELLCPQPKRWSPSGAYHGARPITLPRASPRAFDINVCRELGAERGKRHAMPAGMWGYTIGLNSHLKRERKEAWTTTWTTASPSYSASARPRPSAPRRGKTTSARAPGFGRLSPSASLVMASISTD